MGLRTAGGIRIGGELTLGGGQVHLQSHEALLRSVVDVTLEPTERSSLGGDGGSSRRGEVSDLLLEIA